MMRHTMLYALALQVSLLTWVQCAKQQVQLSDSYLPVAMQIIAHLTDQMAFENADDVTPTTSRTTTAQTKPSTKPPVQQDWTAKPTWTTKPTNKPTSKPTQFTWTTKPPTPSTQFTWTTKPPTPSTQFTWTTKPPTPSTQFTWTTRPATKPSQSWSQSTTQRPYVTTAWPGFKPTTSGWWTTKRPDETTPFHKPGLYAPFSPPKPFFNRYQTRNFLLPMYSSQYTVLGPQETRSGDPLLAVPQEEVQPLVEPSPDDQPLLPPHFDVKISSRSDGFVLEDISAENLQYLSEDVRALVQQAADPHDERVLDVWARSGPQPAASKAKLSTSNLRLLLLYDLLSRDAKKQRLSDYSGFSPDVMKVLVESSSGGARQQLRTALSKMVERKDCGHDYANNRAREMVDELAKDESKLSAELRYLQPLVYKY